MVRLFKPHPSLVKRQGGDFVSLSLTVVSCLAPSSKHWVKGGWSDGSVGAWVGSKQLDPDTGRKNLKCGWICSPGRGSPGKCSSLCDWVDWRQGRGQPVISGG